MTFRASNVIASVAYDLVRRAAVQLKINLQAMNTTLAASGADYDFLKDIYLTLTRANNQFNTLKSTPGLVQYAKDLEVDPAYDVAAEFTAMQGAISAAITWMDNNVPTNVTAKPPNQWTDETLISNEFTPAQTSGLRSALAAVVAEIS